MKGRCNLLGLAVILCPLNAWALDFDWSPDTTRYLSDPTFLPLKGQVETYTAFEYANQNGDLNGGGDHFFAKSDGFTQEVSYGITSRLRFSGSASWSESSTKDSLSDGTQSHGYGHQFDNPTFSLTYRLIEQGKRPINLDLLASFTPEAARSTGERLGGEIRISHTMKSASVQAFAGASYQGSGDEGSTHFSADSDYYIGANGQLRLPHNFAINAGLQFDQAGDKDISNHAATAGYTAQFDPNVTTFVSLEYGILPGRVVAGAKYTHVFMGDETQTGWYTAFDPFFGPYAVNFSNQWIKQSSDAYSVHVRWLF